MILVAMTLRAVRSGEQMRNRRLQVAWNIWTGCLAIAAILVSRQAAYPFHGSPPRPPPPGHGQLIVRLAWHPDPGHRMPEGQVGVQAVSLHQRGASAEDGWMILPLISNGFSARELASGPIWIADSPVLEGEFDRIRLEAGGKSQLPIFLGVPSGKRAILILEVGFEAGRAPEPTRLRLKRAQVVGLP